MNTNVPVMSEGNISDVSCTRLNSSSRMFANDFANRVFAMPGTPSIIACPWANRAIVSNLVSADFPIIFPDISWLIFSCISVANIYIPS